MKTVLVMMAIAGCAADTDFDLGIYTEFFGPDRITEQSIDLGDVEVLFSINTKVKCETEEPVSICVETPTRNWCSGASCATGRYIDIALNFRDGDLPIDPAIAYISGRITYCTGIWITAIR